MPESIDFVNAGNENLSKRYNYWCFGTGCCPGTRFPFVFLVFLQRQNLQKTIVFHVLWCNMLKTLIFVAFKNTPGAGRFVGIVVEF